MKKTFCNSLADLRSAIDELAPDVLFRGQVKNYCDADGNIELSTSFSRNGCIPARMLKWYYYSRTILNSFVKVSTINSDMAHEQAIFQHYGWRSFYVDATSNPRVAAWFAANQFKSSSMLEMTEDCWEVGVMRHRECASYEPSSGTGFLYAISRKELRALGVGAVDLVEITTFSGTPRFLAQSAFMIGNLSHAVPTSAITSVIEAPSEVLMQYSQEVKPLTQDILFPGESSDPVLASLMSLPWVKMYAADNDEIEIFMRSLPLPEYQPSYVKINSPRVAFYRRFWTADFMIHDEDDEPTPNTYYVDDAIYHGSTSETHSLPNVTKLLELNPALIIEIDGLIAHLFDPRNYYGKGVYLRRHPSGHISISEMMVKHEGGLPQPAGASQPWFYSVDDECRWHQVDHPEQCDCGHKWYHDHLASVVVRFERELSQNTYQEIRPFVFADPDVNPSTDSITTRLVGQG